MKVKDIPEIKQLSTPEKILLLEDLWESISADEDNINVPKNHQDELDRRMSVPGELLSLEELQMKINHRK
jgi:putative addiction module component (TIGR02574 family)